ncbi:sensor histidine kinase [Nonomuraea soli]
MELDFSRGGSVARAGSSAWLLILTWPLWSFFSAGPELGPVLWVVAGIGIFATCWISMVRRMFGPGSMTPRPWALIGLLGSVLALLPVLGAPWAYVSFVFVVTALATAADGLAFGVGLAATIAVEVGALLAFGEPIGQIWWVPLIIVVQAVAVQSMKHMGGLLHRLNIAREEVAQLAIDNERLRFARDLHDTLGHTLSSITIRSQLAARLVRSDPERAACEMGDVERAARQALDEVRQAVAGYRAPSLSEELEKASRSLGLAGIRLEVTPAEKPIPAETEVVLAWVVREGATNVLRHGAGARRCWVRLWVDGIEIRDDGNGKAGDPAGSGRRPAGSQGDRAEVGQGLETGHELGLTQGLGTGHKLGAGHDAGAGHPLRTGPGPAGRGPGTGLQGLAERVASAGGRLEVGAPPEGGYRLRVWIPGTEAP